jgi:hypothetical protein
VTSPSGSGRRRTDLRWSLGAAATVSLTLLLLFVGDHRYFFYGDTAAAYYGWWFHLGDLVRHGQWPVLDPHAWRAGNIAAEGQWGQWSPLLVAIGLVASGSSNVLLVASGVKVLLALLGALGAFRVVRSYDVPPAAAYVAAVLVPMGGFTQYLDLPSWAASAMIWALFPWVWWALRRTMLRGANPLPALLLGYLLVTVGYVFGTIMLVILLAACLLDCVLARDRRALVRVLVAGVLLGLVALTVYLPGVLTASVTARSEAYRGFFGGKFTTDPVTLLAGVLPTTAVSSGSDHLLPYAYLAWLLPAAVWLDWGRLRREWRPLGGLLALTAVTFLVVDGPAQIGPLRWPLRLQPFLVTTVAVTLVVLWSRLGLRLTRRRLLLSLGWVLLAAGVALWHDPAGWGGHAGSVVVVGAGLGLVWWLFDRGRLAWVAPAIGALTVAAFAVQHLAYPTPPSPQRNAPTDLADYRQAIDGAVGDVMQVGAADALVQESPAAARTLLLGSGWYLSGHPVQNTYTAISQLTYKVRYCMLYEGDTCPQVLDTLFSTEPTTGMSRVDLLGVSSLHLVRQDFPPATLADPPPGWQVTDSSRYAVLWTRRTPVPGAGSVAWTSPGTRVSDVSADATDTSFHVDAVPTGGGTVVMRLLDWPGYSTSAGSLTDSVDGYLVTVRLPASAAGQTVRVAFHPPGWDAEVAAWVVALVCGAGWSIAHAARRRGSLGGPG